MHSRRRRVVSPFSVSRESSTFESGCPAPPAKPQCGHFTPVPSPVGTPPMARKSRQLATTCSVSWAIETQYLVFIQRPRCTSQGPFDGKGREIGRAHV